MRIHPILIKENSILCSSISSVSLTPTKAPSYHNLQNLQHQLKIKYINTSTVNKLCFKLCIVIEKTDLTYQQRTLDELNHVGCQESLKTNKWQYVLRSIFETVHVGCQESSHRLLGLLFQVATFIGSWQIVVLIGCDQSVYILLSLDAKAVLLPSKSYGNL